MFYNCRYNHHTSNNFWCQCNLWYKLKAIAITDTCNIAQLWAVMPIYDTIYFFWNTDISAPHLLPIWLLFYCVSLKSIGILFQNQCKYYCIHINTLLVLFNISPLLNADCYTSILISQFTLLGFKFIFSLYSFFICIFFHFL